MSISVSETCHGGRESRNIWAYHQKFRWLIRCIAFSRRVPCAGVEAEFALFSWNHPPVSSRNRIGIEPESWHRFNIWSDVSHCKILWSLEAARLVIYYIASLCNLTGTTAAVLPRWLSNFRAIGLFCIQISRLRDFTRSYIKTCLHM